MYTNSPISLPGHLDHPQFNDIETAARDLSILTTMIRQVEDIRKQVEQPIPLVLPVITSATEPGQRTHRVVIYRPLPSDQQELQFVGFVSKCHPDTPDSILTALASVDKSLIMELAEHPGLLNYSSLELANGIWYNLVVFARTEVKNDILVLKTHQMAAYELAPSYYQWIRLHHGTIAGKRLSEGMTLYKTKHYTFHTPAQSPAMHIQTYDPPVALSRNMA
jgi:hypothetical protein